MDDDIAAQIHRVNAKEPGAQDALFAAAYGELRRLARSRLRSMGRCSSLDTTELVHESYFRFIRRGELQTESRRAFFAYASCVMRSVIVDEARGRLTDRRGGDSKFITLDTQVEESTSNGESELVWVHEALEVLAEVEPRLAKVVEMRYFGGYAEVEIADALGTTDRTVRRDWEKARMLLRALLEEGPH
ncbi:ECF-type sigma factor [Variovorax rhizosphaerae]|uniref:ECF-type sigma factor n=1 Tax=Variovorax rhizosphaerae TaxID=1836200 RepID=A0ABU8WPU3_9BURK